jgi:uncharacterized membrane protein
MEIKVNVALWIVQAFLALAFFGAGFDQAVNYNDARRRLPWVGSLSRGGATFIGALEIVGAIGLIVPAWTGTIPSLTILAAAALAVLMGLAVVFHSRRHEIPQLGFSAFCGILAALVAFGRIVVAPF